MSAQILRVLKAKRATIKGQCTRTQNAIDAIDPHAIDFTYVKQRKDKFTDYWNQFNEIQLQIDEVLAIAADLSDVEQLKREQETEYINFDQTYFDIAGKMERFLKVESAVTTKVNYGPGGEITCRLGRRVLYCTLQRLGPPPPPPRRYFAQWRYGACPLREYQYLNRMYRVDGCLSVTLCRCTVTTRSGQQFGDATRLGCVRRTGVRRVNSEPLS